jgi:glycine C-acetyltransferase|tara:strand:+ start:92 stop:1354 length:1263 start_codon:yes stop_codon:yes gene_type:complete
VDIFEKISERRGPLGIFSATAHGYFTFPKLEGPIGTRMQFRGREVLTWSLNNYLGLANHPDVRKVDANAAKEFGLGNPMGARMMSGNSIHHEKLEEDLSKFVAKEDTMLVNYGYMGMSSAVDALVDRKDVIVYDSDCHACIIDGIRMHQGKRFVYAHNDMGKLRQQLDRAVRLTDNSGGGILVITEGVFGMSGAQGKLKEIVDLKKEYDFRLFVDDAHGIGTMGKTGAGTGEEQGVQDGIDVYFGTFAKAFASIGGFISSTEDVVDYLRYNTRSQIFAKSMPMPLVLGNQKRLEMLRDQPEHKANLWEIVNAMQSGLRASGFNLGVTNSCVTPIIMEGGVEEATNMIFHIREEYNLFTSVVVYPVVPKGTILIRIIPTANHTLEDVNQTIEVFKKVKQKLENNEFSKDSYDWAGVVSDKK